MKSLWLDKTILPSFQPLIGDRKTDVLIIGGGMAGVLIASFLDAAGVAYILLEAETIGDGITKHTTAKITSQHGLIYNKLIHEFGVEMASLYLQANEMAVRKYRTFCQTVDCDYEEKDAYVYARDHLKKLEDELEALHQIGYQAEFSKSIPLPFSVVGAVKFSNQAQFHPLKFLAGISKNLHIYEHTKVLELTEHSARTSQGTITAEKIIVATHFPFINKHGSYFLKMYQHRSYVLALENAPDVSGMYVDEAEKGMSFRNYKNLLFIGGGDHRTGKKGGGWEELQHFAKQHYKGANVAYHWATQDCMTLDSVPYIGHYSKNTPDFYVATGFNKWGMTSSMVSAMILSDMVQGKENPYASVFSPSRTMMRPQLASNAFVATMNLLTPSTKRCPHMGCALKWNPEEHSWDCQCHGSRFSQDGNLIDNPATGDLKHE